MRVWWSQRALLRGRPPTDVSISACWTSIAYPSTGVDDLVAAARVANSHACRILVRFEAGTTWSSWTSAYSAKSKSATLESVT